MWWGAYRETTKTSKACHPGWNFNDYLSILIYTPRIIAKTSKTIRQSLGGVTVSGGNSRTYE